MSAVGKQEPQLLSLPFSLLVSIFEFLSVNEIFHLIKVCKRFNQLKKKDKNHSLWKNLCQKKWKELQMDKWLSNLVAAKWKYLMPEEGMMIPDDRDWKWMTLCLSTHVEGDVQTNYGWEIGKTVLGEDRFYVGEYVNGTYHGKGIEIIENRYLYHGDWENGKWHGKGLVLSSNPDTGGLYQGNLAECKSHGKGVKIWNNGPRYEGEWRENKMHGEGLYLWDTGEKYEGHWESGMMSGYGVNFWADGTKHVGLWKNGTAHGRGSRFDKKGLVIDGEWENGHQTVVYSSSHTAPPVPEKSDIPDMSLD
jgi:hypothetical protein